MPGGPQGWGQRDAALQQAGLAPTTPADQVGLATPNSQTPSAQSSDFVQPTACGQPPAQQPLGPQHAQGGWNQVPNGPAQNFAPHVAGQSAQGSGEWRQQSPVGPAQTGGEWNQVSVPPQESGPASEASNAAPQYGWGETGATNAPEHGTAQPGDPNSRQSAQADNPTPQAGWVQPGDLNSWGQAGATSAPQSNDAAPQRASAQPDNANSVAGQHSWGPTGPQSGQANNLASQPGRTQAGAAQPNDLAAQSGWGQPDPNAPAWAQSGDPNAPQPNTTPQVGWGQPSNPHAPAQPSNPYAPAQSNNFTAQPGWVNPNAPAQPNNFAPGWGQPNAQQGYQQPPPSLDNVPIRRAKKAPGGGWRKAVHHMSGGAINPGMSAEELRLQELVARIRQPVRGDYRIAVLSLKGGVGKTTTTTGLGSIFASIRGDRVIAVDANPDFGTLSQRVALQTRSTVRDLLLDPSIERYSDVRKHTSQSSSRLEVLASERDPAASESFNDEEYRAVARILQRYYNIILTDCGTGLMHSAMNGVLDLAHSLVLISSAAIDGARSAAATLDWLSLHGHDHLVRNAVVVINLPREGSANVGVQKLREYFLARCRAVHIIPFDEHLSEGSEIDLHRLHKATKRAYVELAATVADEF
ncbi:hypothetical protein GCM10011591_31940 [Nocardia camponoti]|uniref:CobQ/CobB/MinD/ParA nucleotide binding domain-containing protein n=1 Tax=Nocardia camponoti TaxID=1616106 RepID=A0A917QME5_9NOCA|nr:hypothetical protein GCM10011591_31940 [Nocardia camponoti]